MWNIRLKWLKIVYPRWNIKLKSFTLKKKKKKKNYYFRIIIIYMQIISYIINKFGEIITNNTINNSKLIHYYKE